MTISVALLGDVELRRDGVRLPLPAGKTTALLARLALETGRPVSVDRILADLWPGGAVATNRNTLQSKVSQLRRTLGQQVVLSGTAAGYRLELDAEAVDANAAMQAAVRVRSLRLAGDLDGVLTVSAAALELFRGELVAGAEDAWLDPYRTQLAEVRRELHTAQLTVRVDRSVSSELIAELELLVADDPLREDLWSLLITSLYRSGRQADALGAYRRVQQLLDQELGLRPGPALQRMEQQVLRHDPELDPPPPSIQVPRVAAQVAVSARGNLPGAASSLIGRADELRLLTGHLGRHHLVTVTGPAGVGKTRLAVEVARRIDPPGGSWLIRLEYADNPRALRDAVTAVLDLQTGFDGPLPERLRGEQMLLVLDNCEHLITDVAEFIDQLLRFAPDLLILATSQLPLGLDGELVFPLDPLELGDAVALFNLRAVERRPSYVPDASNEHVVEHLCRSLDRLPLAIELAAGRMKALSVEEISRRLTDRFALLNDPTERAHTRHRTLHAALTWSYELLFPDDQRGLWALSCFTDGAPLDAAEFVVNALGVPRDAALDVITRLIDRSLAWMQEEPGGHVRYRVLDSVRAFAAERSDSAGGTEVARRALADWLAAAAGAAAEGSRGAEQAAHLRIARSERANIESALSWCAAHEPLTGLRIANGFGWSWVVLGDGVSGAHRLRSALAAAAEADPHDRLTALWSASWLEASAGNLEQAAADIEQASRLARAFTEPDAVASAVANTQLYHAFVLISAGRPVEALAELERCRPILRQSTDRWSEGGSWLLSAYAELALGRTARGGTACTEALRLLTPIGDDWGLAHAEAMLGALASSENRHSDAVLHFRRAATSAAVLGFTGAEAYHLSNLGRAEQLSGNPGAASTVLAEAESKGLAVGDLRLVAETRVRQARVHRESGDATAARDALTLATDWYRRSGGGEGARLAEVLLAASEAELGIGIDVDDRLSRLLTEARHAADTEVQTLALDAQAARAAQRGDLTDARSTLDRADRVAAGMGHPVAGRDRVDALRTRALLQAITSRT